MRESITAGSQRLLASKTWLGSETVNILQVLCELLEIVRNMNIQIAEHAHGPTPLPNNSPTFNSLASLSFDLSRKAEEATEKTSPTT